MLSNGRVARMAAIFPLKHCQVIFLGLRNQPKKDGILLNRHVVMQEHNRDAKLNLTHDDDCGYNLD